MMSLMKWQQIKRDRGKKWVLRMFRELTETTPKELWGERKHRIERQSEDLEKKKTRKYCFAFILIIL